MPSSNGPDAVVFRKASELQSHDDMIMVRAIDFDCNTLENDPYFLTHRNRDMLDDVVLKERLIEFVRLVKSGKYEAPDGGRLGNWGEMFLEWLEQEHGYFQLIAYAKTIKLYGPQVLHELGE